MSLVRFVVTLGATWEEAEDAVGDVLAELLPRWNQIRSPRAYCRKASERAYVNSEVRLRKAPEAAVRGHWTSAAQQGATDAYEGLEQEYALRHLRLLNQEQRRVMAYVFDGYQPEEIAALLGKNPGTVRSNIRHARKRLKTAIIAERERELSETTNGPGTQTHLGGS
ncbi:RNA polymerase sigma factor [Streptomyces sp. NPDC088788]|uniref:RNA polymerase sigma factor n=1 Tax=Streptomyces sp. NPDC088788 TaxID=3365898 RepID=UPI0038056D6E